MQENLLEDIKNWTDANPMDTTSTELLAVTRKTLTDIAIILHCHDSISQRIVMACFRIYTRLIEHQHDFPDQFSSPANWDNVKIHNGKNYD